MDENDNPSITTDIIGPVEYNNGGKVFLIEPNSVTNAKYDFSAVQENVLICIIAAWQKYMTNGGLPVEGEAGIHHDLFQKPYVRLKASEIAKGNHKSYVWEQLRDMRKKDFTFTYSKRFKDNYVNEKVNTALIGTIRNVEGSDYIDVSVSEWAIPYLLYWGKGVGGTVFNKVIAIRLRKVYAKRLYKLCKQWEDKGGFTLTLKEFREKLGLENLYERTTALKERVLDPAKAELNELADVSFEWAFVKTGREVTGISFRVFGKKTGTGNVEWYSKLFRHLTVIFRELKDNQIRTICDKITTDGMIRRASDRFDELVSEVNHTKEDIYYIGKTILVEDYAIDVSVFGKVKGAKAKKLSDKKTPSTVGNESAINHQRMFGGIQSIGDVVSQIGLFSGNSGNR